MMFVIHRRIIVGVRYGSEDPWPQKAQKEQKYKMAAAWYRSINSRTMPESAAAN